MTAGQKRVKAKFKQAIAIRKRTGCSLKEAFAAAYGKKKIGAIKKKRTVKKSRSVKRKAPKLKVQKVVTTQTIAGFKSGAVSLLKASLGKKLLAKELATTKRIKRSYQREIAKIKSQIKKFIS